MRLRLIGSVLLLLLAASAPAGQWVQESWVDGPTGTLDQLWGGEFAGSFYDSEALAWWRYVENESTGDNLIFPYAPATGEVKLFGAQTLNGMRSCAASYIKGENAYLVVGGRDGEGKPCLYYSGDSGVIWTKNRDPMVINGTVLAVAQQPDSDRLHLLVSAGNNEAAIYILEGLDDTSWTSFGSVSPDIAAHASFLFDKTNRGFLTLDLTQDLHRREKLWLWNGVDWTIGTHEFDQQDRLYDIWRMGEEDLYLAADRPPNYTDLCFYSTDNGLNWQDWGTDYFPGENNYPCFVSVGPGYGWQGAYAYLTSAGSPIAEVCRIDYNNPSDFKNFKPKDAASLDAVLVGDDGAVYLTGTTVSEASLWVSKDDGWTWDRHGLPGELDGLSTAPVMVQDPRFGFLYVTGDKEHNEKLPCAVFMAAKEAWLESLPYDCGGPTRFLSVELKGFLADPGPDERLELYLRSANNPQMVGALEWDQCDEITDYGNLGGVGGLRQGERYVQYRLVFESKNDVPLSFPAVDLFRLNYEPWGDAEGPRVESTVPPDGADNVPLNAEILVAFDRRMNLDSFTDNFLVTCGGDEIAWSGRLEGNGLEFIAKPDSDLPSNSRIDVLLGLGITDSDGAPIEDQNGDEEGAYDFSFRTGGVGDVDNEPPEVTELKANPNPTFGADWVSLTCLADDTERGGSLIAGGEYFVDAAGSDGSGMPLSPADGDYDDPVEGLLAIIDASGWSMGSTHIIFLHARDAAGNWSPLQSLVVETEGEFFDPKRVYVWPNPASDTARFAFTVGGDARVELAVYDLAGRLVHRDSGDFTPGEPGLFVWNLEGVASDAYIFRLAAEETGGMRRTASVVKKLAVVR